jgi:type II secretion system protein G
MNKNKGFTLIELLVVIAIIGILASVVLSSLNSARASARDAKRTGDIKAVITALELYRNQNSQYPTPSLTSAACGGANFCLAPVSSLLVSGSFLGQIPVDPTYTNNANNYRYCGNATSYMILRRKETINTWCQPPGIPTVSACNGWSTSPGVPDC